MIELSAQLRRRLPLIAICAAIAIGTLFNGDAPHALLVAATVFLIGTVFIWPVTEFSKGTVVNDAKGDKQPELIEGRAPMINKPDLKKFKELFVPFQEFNPRAFEMALQHFLAVVELTTAPHYDFTLFQNLADEMASCLNELQSLLLSIERRSLLEALQDRIQKLADHFENIKHSYLSKLPKAPKDVQWEQYSTREKGRPQPFLIPTSPAEASIASFDWHIADNHY